MIGNFDVTTIIINSNIVLVKMPNIRPKVAIDHTLWMRICCRGPVSLYHMFNLKSASFQTLVPFPKLFWKLDLITISWASWLSGRTASKTATALLAFDQTWFAWGQCHHIRSKNVCGSFELCVWGENYSLWRECQQLSGINFDFEGIFYPGTMN